MDESKIKALIQASENRVKAELSSVKSHVSREAQELKNAVVKVAVTRPVVTATIAVLSGTVGYFARWIFGG